MSHKVFKYFSGSMLFSILNLGMIGCGSSTSLSTKQFFTIEMYGVDLAPDGAAGDVTPKWQSYTLTGVSFVSEDGATVSTIYDGTDPQTYKVVNRTQQIYSKDVTELSGTVFSNATVTFDAAVTGGSSVREDHSFTLTDPALTLGSQFEIEDGKNRRFIITIHWKNTVTGDEMAEPTFSMAVD